MPPGQPPWGVANAPCLPPPRTSVAQYAPPPAGSMPLGVAVLPQCPVPPFGHLEAPPAMLPLLHAMPTVAADLASATGDEGSSDGGEGEDSGGQTPPDPMLGPRQAA